MRIVTVPIVTTCLLAALPKCLCYVSGVNPRLTTPEPPSSLKIEPDNAPATFNTRIAKSTRGNDDRITFSSPWSGDDFGDNFNANGRKSQVVQSNTGMRTSQTSGSFKNSYPSSQSMQRLRRPDPQETRVYPFERDDDDDRPIWRDTDT